MGGNPTSGVFLVIPGPELSVSALWGDAKGAFSLILALQMLPACSMLGSTLYLGSNESLGTQKAATKRFKQFCLILK